MSLFTNPQDDQPVKRLLALLRQLLRQQGEFLKLSLAEKLTAIIGQMLMLVCIAIFGAVASAFIALAIVHLLALWIPMFASYAVVSALFTLFIYIVVRFRNRLIFDPLARTITSKIIDNPNEQTDETEQ